jgi:hypothetical protein
MKYARLLGCYAVWLFVTTDVSEERIAIIRLIKIGKLGTTLAVTSNCVFLRNVLRLLVIANVPSSSSP